MLSIELRLRLPDIMIRNVVIRAIFFIMVTSQIANVHKSPKVTKGLKTTVHFRPHNRTYDTLYFLLLLRGFPDLEVLLEGPHFVAVSGGGHEVEVGGGLLHVALCLLDGLLHLRS